MHQLHSHATIEPAGTVPASGSLSNVWHGSTGSSESDDCTSRTPTPPSNQRGQSPRVGRCVTSGTDLRHATILTIAPVPSHATIEPAGTVPASGSLSNVCHGSTGFSESDDCTSPLPRHHRTSGTVPASGSLSNVWHGSTGSSESDDCTSRTPTPPWNQRGQSPRVGR
ncbi:MAG UNVERIFIED_CONTAM: hypothetical protein LVR18_00305 [Planctomycetaceae bacterium]